MKLYEVICYAIWNDKETNHSIYFRSLEQAELWAVQNVKRGETAEIHHVQTGQLVKRFWNRFNETIVEC